MRAALGLAFLGVCVLTGCPGPGGGSDPDDLVGTWRQVAGPNDDATDLETLTIAADGTYSRTDPDGLLDSGTYDADSERVTIHASANGEDHTIDQGYAIAGDQLGVGTLFPDGDVDGVVGAWHGEFHQDAASIAVDLDLRADGTSTYHAVGTSDGTIDFTGTWSSSGSDVTITWPVAPNQNVNLYAKSIAGVAIADKLYQRVP